jgi:hypothetical protein
VLAKPILVEGRGHGNDECIGFGRPGGDRQPAARRRPGTRPNQRMWIVAASRGPSRSHPPDDREATASVGAAAVYSRTHMFLKFKKAPEGPHGGHALQQLACGAANSAVRSCVGRHHYTPLKLGARSCVDTAGRSSGV